MNDIIAEMPWHCGERDCPVGWHKINYWIQLDGGYTVDSYSDGDHEDIDEEDLPSVEKIDAAWERYRKDVVATGEDPLSQYSVSHTYKRRARYKIEFRNSIGGAFLCRWKQGRKPWSYDLPPEHLAGYFLLYTDWDREAWCRRPLKDKGVNGERDTWFTLKELIELGTADEHIDKVTQYSRATIFHLTLEEEVERSPFAVKRELRRSARRKT